MPMIYSDFLSWWWWPSYCCENPINLWFVVLRVATTRKNLKKIMYMYFCKIQWSKKNLHLHHCSKKGYGLFIEMRKFWVFIRGVPFREWWNIRLDFIVLQWNCEKKRSLFFNSDQIFAQNFPNKIETVGQMA